MCGISGVFRPDRRPVDPARVERMMAEMVFRGPDGSGMACGPGFVLGHRRLSIIDLSDAGTQPLGNEDGAVQITFNGEIYNFADLRTELEAKGHRFHSATDTETLVHGYEEWGLEGLLRRIRGMYAFAIVDQRNGSIHLARDPLGKKPLFYHWAAGELTFASSARALVRGLDSVPEVRPGAVDELLWNLYIPGAETIFRGVRKLLPGHALSIDANGGESDLEHWRPDFSHPETGVSREEWLERMEAALTSAVKRRLVADVPVGVLLSGGVDSSVVTALAARASGRVKTFSVSTVDPALDESRYARAVATQYGTEHLPLEVHSNIAEDLPKLVAAMGEPLGDSATANLFAISRSARQSVTVALMGDGGDEAFGGYPYFLGYHLAEKPARLLSGPLAPLATAGSRGLRTLPGIGRRLGTYLRLASAPIEQTMPYSFATLSPQAREALYTPQFAARLNGHAPDAHFARTFEEARGGTLVDRAMHAHMRTILADQFLVKADVGSMAVSLEARSPFLDVAVVDLAMRIPPGMRFAGGEPKGLLRSLARRLLPPEVVNRRKQGFTAPLSHWFRDWGPLMNDLVLGPQVERRGWFRRPALEALVQEQRTDPKGGGVLWTLMMLEIWLRMTVDGTLRPTDSLA